VRHLLVIASLFFSFNLFAASQPLMCGPTIQGIGDAFPWGLGKAQPFPWTKVQGLWRVDGNLDLVLKLKVIRQTTNLKQLDVQIFSKVHSCNNPIMHGVGIITTLEQNVVRIIIDNKLIKLAAFNASDLEINPAVCGEQVFAASMFELGSDLGTVLDVETQPMQVTNMLLKKISTSLDLVCKKR
jgi:hypothetical protein